MNDVQRDAGADGLCDAILPSMGDKPSGGLKGNVTRLCNTFSGKVLPDGRG